jgi:hypothetical protein
MAKLDVFERDAGAAHSDEHGLAVAVDDGAALSFERNRSAEA